MTLAYEHSSRPDPDGLHPAPRTLRDAQHDPHDWIEHTAASANDDEAALYTEDDGATAPVLGVAILIAAAVLAMLVALVIVALRSP